MRKLQVALDFIDLEKAVEIALEVSDVVDYIEAGTPLIKSNGIKCVERLSDETGKPIIADMKIMDTGALEAEIAFNSGAYGVTVLAAAHPKTIRDVVETASKYNGVSYVDTIGLTNPSEILKKLDAASVQPTYILIHSGIDMQETGITPHNILSKRNGEIARYGKLAVAGGINSENIWTLLPFKEIEVFIVGGGITRSKHPLKEAKLLKTILDQT